MKLQKTGILVLSSVILVLFFSCKKKTETPPDLGYSYFPGVIGSWIIYDVDSTYYDSVSNITTTIKFQQKDSVESLITDNSGRATLRIERYKRYYDASTPYAQLPWNIADVITANMTASTAEIVEGNQRYIRLIFPPKLNKKWNGNASNAQDRWDYEYTSVNSSTTLNATYDSTITVSQSGLNDPIINTQLSTEMYAKHIGLIYKRFQYLTLSPDTSGSEYTMTMSDYSH